MENEVYLPAALPEQRLQLHEESLGVLAAALLARQERQQDERAHHEPGLQKRKIRHFDISLLTLFLVLYKEQESELGT